MSRLRPPARRGGGLLLVLLLFAQRPAQAQAAGLEIVSQPGVAVTWEGVELGVTDETGALAIGGIPPGTYSVTLSKPGYETLSLPLVVRPGTTTISLRLEPLPPQPAPSRPVETEPAPATAQAEAAPRAAGPAAPPQLEPAPEAVVSPPPERAAPAPPPATNESAPESLPLLLLLPVGLAAAALWLIARSRRAAAAALATGPAHGSRLAAKREPSDVSPAAESSASRELLEELQRREMALDGGKTEGRARRRPEVIEVREFKVIEDDS